MPNDRHIGKVSFETKPTVVPKTKQQQLTGVRLANFQRQGFAIQSCLLLACVNVNYLQMPKLDGISCHSDFACYRNVASDSSLPMT